ncbi:MAG: hypothetical protein H6740_02535 [Alphaproteobacteria bacterium]|nr:hypothetical protein [Alphaproteobacteria bacterium]
MPDGEEVEAGTDPLDPADDLPAGDDTGIVDDTGVGGKNTGGGGCGCASSGRRAGRRGLVFLLLGLVGMRRKD